jgi:hypothetical protein
MTLTTTSGAFRRTNWGEPLPISDSVARLPMAQLSTLPDENVFLGIHDDHIGSLDRDSIFTFNGKPTRDGVREYIQFAPDTKSFRLPPTSILDREIELNALPENMTHSVQSSEFYRRAKENAAESFLLPAYLYPRDVLRLLLTHGDDVFRYEEEGYFTLAPTDDLWEMTGPVINESMMSVTLRDARWNSELHSSSRDIMTILVNSGLPVFLPEYAYVIARFPRILAYHADALYKNDKLIYPLLKELRRDGDNDAFAWAMALAQDSNESYWNWNASSKMEYTWRFEEPGVYLKFVKDIKAAGVTFDQAVGFINHGQYDANSIIRFVENDIDSGLVDSL